MRKLFNFYLLAALTVGAVSCSKDDPEPVYSIKLAATEDEAITIEATPTGDAVVNIVTDAPLQAIKVEQTSGDEGWCTATVESTSKIVVKAGENRDEENDRVAEFTVTAGNATAKFTVTQLKYIPPKNTLSIACDDLTFDPNMNGYTYTSAAANGFFTVKVTTDADKWEAKSDDFMGGELSWVMLTPQGDDLYVTIMPNTEAMMRNGAVTISAGNADPIMIMIMQMPAEAGESPATMCQAYSDADFKTNVRNNTTVNVAATDPKPIIYYLKTNGGIDWSFFDAATSNQLAQGWADVNLTKIGEDADGLIKYQLVITPNSNTTGAERKINVVVVDSGEGWDLYTVPLVQAAK